MRLFSFLKSLFAKADAIEKQVDSFVTEVEAKAPAVALKVKAEIVKAKNVKADVKEAVVKVSKPKAKKTTK
jgi:hypothetical protein